MNLLKRQFCQLQRNAPHDFKSPLLSKINYFQFNFFFFFHSFFFKNRIESTLDGLSININLNFHFLLFLFLHFEITNQKHKNV